MFARRLTYQMSPDPAPAGATPPPPTDPPPAPGAPPADPPGRSNDPAILSARLDKSIESEKAARDRAQKAEAELQRLATVEADRQKKLLEEQGKHKELYEKAEADRKALADRVATYETAQRARADAALAQIPEHLRAYAPADPVKAEEYAAQLQKSLTTAPGAPPAIPSKPATAPAAPPAPGGSPQKPEFPKVAFERLSYLGKSPAADRADAEAKVAAWKKWITEHPEDAR